MNAPARSSVFQDVASAIGHESAHQLIVRMGGQRIYVRREIERDDPIAKAIGLEAAQQLATYYHGTWLSLPVAATRQRQVKELGREGGKTRQQIAAETGYSERQVYRILGESSDDRQGDLFGTGD